MALSRDLKKEHFARKLGAHEYIDDSKSDAEETLQYLGEASLIVATPPSADAIIPLLKGLGILGKLLILSSRLAVVRLILARAILIWHCSSWRGSRGQCCHGKARLLPELMAKQS